MKTNNIFKSFALIIGVLAVCAVACTDESLNKVNPVFPELVENYTVAPGDTLKLTFTPNVNWEVAVPEDTMDFFWLIDGDFQYSKLSGKASEEPVTVLVGVSDKVDFVNHTTTVKLTMGGETRVIAKYMCPSANKSLQMYVCQLDEDGSFKFDDNGDYAFEQVEADSVKLIWTGSDFRIRVKLVSNFEWTMNLPTWAVADIPEEKIGVQEFNIYGDPTSYPLDESEGVLSVIDGKETVTECPIVIPGCYNILSYGVDMVSSLDFNNKGQYVSSVRFVEGPATAWLLGVEKADVYAVEFKNGKYSLSVSPSWLNLEVSDYDRSAGAEVLQRREVKISVKEYDGTDHTALLLFLPPTTRAKLKNFFNDDQTALKDEWLENAVSLTFKKYGYVTIPDTASMEEGGATFTQNSVHHLIRADYSYDLTYDNEYASDNARMLFLEPYGSYKIYNSNGVEVTDTEGFFLSFSGDETKESGVVNMSGGRMDSGYIAFYSEDGKTVLAEIKCIYEPKETVEDTSVEDVIVDASSYFMYPAAAAEAGVSMIEYQAGPTRRDCEDAINDGAVLLRMTSPLETPVQIRIPLGARMVAAYPKECFDLGGLDMSAGGAYIAGKTDISISFTQFPSQYLPDENDPDKEYITPSVRFYNKNDKAVLVIYCEIAK